MIPIKPTSESAIESYIEDVLLTQSGWRKGSVGDWDKDRAVFLAEAIALIQGTQPAVWDQMAGLHGAELAAKLTTITGWNGLHRRPSTWAMAIW